MACRAAPERAEGAEIVCRLSQTSPCRGAAYLADQSFASIRTDNEELVKLLVAIVKTSRKARMPVHSPLSMLRENPRMPAREVVQQIGISSRKVEKNIAKLKALTLLKRIGPAKGGYWHITEDQRKARGESLMQVARQFIEVTQRQVVIELPESFVNHRCQSPG